LSDTVSFSPVESGFFGVISGYRREEAEICAVLGYYVAYGGNSLPTFRDNLSVTLENVTYRLPRKAGKELPLYAV
jgi:hypothetical protein